MGEKMMEKMRELKRRVRTDSGLIKTVSNVFQRQYLMKTTMKRSTSH